jgi:hypothetical protein
MPTARMALSREFLLMPRTLLDGVTLLDCGYFVIGLNSSSGR